MTEITNNLHSVSKQLLPATVFLQSDTTDSIAAQVSQLIQQNKISQVITLIENFFQLSYKNTTSVNNAIQYSLQQTENKHVTVNLLLILTNVLLNQYYNLWYFKPTQEKLALLLPAIEHLFTTNPDLVTNNYLSLTKHAMCIKYFTLMNERENLTTYIYTLYDYLEKRLQSKITAPENILIKNILLPTLNQTWPSRAELSAEENYIYMELYTALINAQLLLNKNTEARYLNIGLHNFSSGDSWLDYNLRERSKQQALALTLKPLGGLAESAWQSGNISGGLNSYKIGMQMEADKSFSHDRLQLHAGLGSTTWLISDKNKPIAQMSVPVLNLGLASKIVQNHRVGNIVVKELSTSLIFDWAPYPVQLTTLNSQQLVLNNFTINTAVNILLNSIYIPNIRFGFSNNLIFEQQENVEFTTHTELWDSTYVLVNTARKESILFIRDIPMLSLGVSRLFLPNLNLDLAIGPIINRVKTGLSLNAKIYYLTPSHKYSLACSYEHYAETSNIYTYGSWTSDFLPAHGEISVGINLYQKTSTNTERSVDFNLAYTMRLNN
jgi:hypothetical protein